MTKMKPSTILKRARKLIEKGWCRGVAAVTKSGTPVLPRSKHACRWCVSGAIQVYDRDDGFNACINYLSSAVGSNIICFNDEQTNKKPVLRAFDRAIALALKEGQ